MSSYKGVNDRVESCQQENRWFKNQAWLLILVTLSLIVSCVYRTILATISSPSLAQKPPSSPLSNHQTLFATSTTSFVMDEGNIDKHSPLKMVCLHFNNVPTQKNALLSSFRSRKKLPKYLEKLPPCDTRFFVFLFLVNVHGSQ